MGIRAASQFIFPVPGEREHPHAAVPELVEHFQLSAQSGAAFHSQNGSELSIVKRLHDLLIIRSLDNAVGVLFHFCPEEPDILPEELHCLFAPELIRDKDGKCLAPPAPSRQTLQADMQIIAAQLQIFGTADSNGITVQIKEIH